MGFYFRKSKSVGPFRLNLSKSGLGVSTGVKGARVSFGPRGTYVNVGRNGLYYRKKIGGSKKRAHTSVTSPRQKPEYAVRSNYVAQPVEQQFDAIRVQDNRINESDFGKNIRKDINRSRVIFWLWIVLSIALLYYIKEWAIPVAIAVRVIFFNFFIARIDYDLDEDASQEWDSFCESITTLKKSKRIWMVESATYNSNTKVQAGAFRNVNRSVVKIRKIPSWLFPKFRIKTDVPKIMIDGKNCDIMFLPSDVIVKKGIHFYSFPYEQLRVTDSTTNFIEHSQPVRDAEVVRWTWQYVNKDGSPDRRYKGNVQYPVCRYGLVSIYAGDNLRVELHVSNNNLVRDIGSTFRRYRSFVMLLARQSIEEKDNTLNEDNYYGRKPVVESQPPEPPQKVAPTPLDASDITRLNHDAPKKTPEPFYVDTFKEAAAVGANLFSDMNDESVSEKINDVESADVGDAMNSNQFADIFAVEDNDDLGIEDSNVESNNDKAVDDIMNFFD